MGSIGLPLLVAMQGGKLLFDEEDEKHIDRKLPLTSHGVDAVKAKWHELEHSKTKVLAEYKIVGLFAAWLTDEEQKSYDKQVAMIKKGSVTMPTLVAKPVPKAPSKPSKKADKANDEVSLEALLGFR
eukprot:4384025-Amphidinium_carterae.3